MPWCPPQMTSARLLLSKRIPQSCPHHSVYGRKSRKHLQSHRKGVVLNVTVDASVVLQTVITPSRGSCWAHWLPSIMPRSQCWNIIMNIASANVSTISMGIYSGPYGAVMIARPPTLAVHDNPVSNTIRLSKPRDGNPSLPHGRKITSYGKSFILVFSYHANMVDAYSTALLPIDACPGVGDARFLINSLYNLKAK